MITFKYTVICSFLINYLQLYFKNKFVALIDNIDGCLLTAIKNILLDNKNYLKFK